MTKTSLAALKWQIISLAILLAAASPSEAQLADVSTLVDQARGMDLNQDGIPEINQLNIVPDWSAKSVDADDRLLYVLVEDRLLKNAADVGDKQLETALATYAQSLAHDGWTPVVVKASLYRGPIHQDGRTLLAVRRFFAATKARFPGFGGAVLIGSFPESMLVRRWVWKHNRRSAKFKGVTYNQGQGPQATFVALDPELISHRSDVVLCDLDGNWEALYHQPPTSIDLIKFLPNEDITQQYLWPRFDQTIQTDKFSIQQKTYEDCFFIDDAKLEIVERTTDSLTLKCDYETVRPEVAQSDRESINPLAQPEIMVSRINPLHVAVVQPAENLDENGIPKAVPKSAGSPNQAFVRDPDFERQLLVDYLNRNVAHRNGQLADEANRIACLWTDLQTPSKNYFSKLSAQLNGTTSFPRADAVAFARFVQTPAIIKGVSAHSNPSCSVLMKGYKPEELAAVTGGNYWYWKQDGDHYVPSYSDRAVRDRAHFSLLKTLWENGKLDDAGGSFYIHGGCEAISPANAAKEPYHSPKYGGHGQISESLLFYGNGLALIGRSKVFYDIPRGFDESFAVDRGRFGDILVKYFEIEAADEKVGRDVAGRNRCYFWSIIGDWTLRLKYDNAQVH